ncbi:MAG: 6-phosphogluconolactonase [Gammaproteobacteria bacterium]|nr:6-phosphogluconolactonase [Gammaproteobacteria bacterium]
MQQWNRFDDADQLAQEAAWFIADRIEEILASRPLCHIALPGGSTPAQCLRYLAEKSLEWARIHWYLTDERCYPPGHPERNDQMLDENLWSLINADSSTIHRIPAELGPEQAALQYAEEIAAINALDIVVLGMGEDGHTASLFPRNPALNEHALVVPVDDAPKPPSQRVSLGMNALHDASFRIVLAAGEGKAEALDRVRKKIALPISQVGHLIWFVDTSALSEL